MSEFTCLRCDNSWNGRLDGDAPKNCPRCKSPAWNKPRATRSAIRKAHVAVAKAKDNGEVTAKPCECCGTPDGVVAHHEDYDAPLDITWLCGSCHTFRHQQIGGGAIDPKTDEIKLQAALPVSIHRAAMVKVATDASTLGHYVAGLIAKDLKLPAPVKPQRGAPKK